MDLVQLEKLGYWHTTENWIARLEGSIYYQSKEGPELFKHIKAVLARWKRETLDCSSEMAYCLSMIVARRLIRACYCLTPAGRCPLDQNCRQFRRWTGLIERDLVEYCDPLLISNFGSTNLQAIQCKLAEFKLRKIA